MSPTFNSLQIFDSLRDDGTTQFSEGTLAVEDYAPEIQKLHFSGEDGDRYLTHGFPDRQWLFEGLLSAPSYQKLVVLINTIQTYIDEFQTTPTTTHSLKDSFGNTFTNAQIHHLHFNAKPHIKTGGGYVCAVRVAGIVSGTSSNKENSSSSS